MEKFAKAEAEAEAKAEELLSAVLNENSTAEAVAEAENK